MSHYYLMCANLEKIDTNEPELRMRQQYGWSMITGELELQVSQDYWWVRITNELGLQGKTGLQVNQDDVWARITDEPGRRMDQEYECSFLCIIFLCLAFLQFMCLPLLLFLFIEYAFMHAKCFVTIYFGDIQTHVVYRGPRWQDDVTWIVIFRSSCFISQY